MSVFENFPRITPFLWFDSNAEEAVEFYLTVFKNSRRLDGLRDSNESSGPKGSVLTIAFELDGQTFTALNGGPMFKFTEAVSFVVRCDSQEEVDSTGRSSRRVGARANAAGSRISSDSRGRLCPRACPSSSKVLKWCRPCLR